MHFIPLGAIDLLRGHLEGGPSDKPHTAMCCIRGRDQALTTSLPMATLLQGTPLLLRMRLEAVRRVKMVTGFGSLKAITL